MATVSNRYTLEKIQEIIFNGFDYQIPDDVMEKISNLAIQVGSPDYVKTPVFKKRENPMKTVSTESNMNSKDQRRRKGNKSAEIINDEEWDNIRTFQSTKIESKTGIDGNFDSIRAQLNKLTDKNFIEQRNKIVEIIEKIVLENPNTDFGGIGANVFDIASSNRFYSKIYAELYSYLSSKFDFIKTKYEENFTKFTELFNNIEYVDPNVNYDRFCEINKINEKRKALATFYINLMNNGVISKTKIIEITRNLVAKVYELISIDNKKNEVEEFTETIAILYNKELYEDEDNESYDLIDGFTISEVIEKIANSRVKDYKSLSNKALFKFMDLIDM